MTIERTAFEAMERAAAQTEEIRRAVLRIEDAVGRLKPNGTVAAGAETAGGVLERLSLQIRDVRTVQGETAAALAALREDVQRLAASGLGNLAAVLGPDGAR